MEWILRSQHYQTRILVFLADGKLLVWKRGKAIMDGVSEIEHVDNALHITVNVLEERPHHLFLGSLRLMMSYELVHFFLHTRA